MLVIGLTGGIGSGKSTVAELFASHGVAITDTDAIAHRLTALGEPALEEISNIFGKDILLENGALNRSLLRQKVFVDAESRKALEKILHPRIREVAKAELLTHTHAPYRIIVVPLLFETSAYNDVINRVLVVDCPENLQIERVLARSNLKEAEIRAIIATQCIREQRLAYADDVISNISDHENLANQVADMHKKYLTLA